MITVQSALIGDELLTHSNAFALSIPNHRSETQTIAFSSLFLCGVVTACYGGTAVLFVWEKLIGIHDCKSFTVYIIPALAHILTFKSAVTTHSYPTPTH